MWDYSYPYWSDLSTNPNHPYAGSFWNLSSTGPPGTNWSGIQDAAGNSPWVSMTTPPAAGIGQPVACFFGMNLRFDPFYLPGPFFEWNQSTAASYSGVLTKFLWYKCKRVEFTFNPQWNESTGQALDVPTVIAVRDSVAEPGAPIPVTASESAWQVLQTDANIVIPPRRVTKPFSLSLTPYYLSIEAGASGAQIASERVYPWFPVPDFSAAPTSSNNYANYPGYYILFRVPNQTAAGPTTWMLDVRVRAYFLAYDYSDWIDAA